MWFITRNKWKHCVARTFILLSLSPTAGLKAFCEWACNYLSYPLTLSTEGRLPQKDSWSQSSLEFREQGDRSWCVNYICIPQNCWEGEIGWDDMWECLLPCQSKHPKMLASFPFLFHHSQHTLTKVMQLSLHLFFIIVSGSHLCLLDLKLPEHSPLFIQLYFCSEPRTLLDHKNTYWLI